MASITKKTHTQILAKFLGSGINIAPRALNHIHDLPLSMKAIENLIQKISFSPDFSSYLTEDRLQQEMRSSQENITLDAQNRRETNLEDIKSSNVPIKSDIATKDSNAMSSNNQHPNINTKNDIPIPSTPSPNSIFMPEEGEEVMDSPILNEMDERENSLEASIPSLPSSPSITSTPTSNTENSAVQEVSPPSEVDEIARIRKEKQEKWEKLVLNEGTSTFRPIAADVDAQIEILQDPTGQLYTTGKLGEFIAVMKDKYTKIRNILKRRPEGNEIIDIGMINRLDNSVEVKFIGMMVEKRQTSNKNYIIKFEDPTGMCTTLVRQEPVELYSLMTHLLPDQVVIVEGYLSVKQQTNSRIILVNNIIFPDAPKRPAYSGGIDDIAICMISDIHFGSKEWLGNVWKRFVDYLNCRIGNDRQREQAGKIKYLCVAGDIVDGIGIFPNQDKRLSITDIYQQYEACADYFEEIPDYINIILSPGDHDAVRNAIPRPALDKEIAKRLYDDSRITMLGCPSLINLHGVKTQLFHGTSLIDLNMSIPGMTNEDPVKTMKEFILCRHLAPSYGKKTRIAPVEKDWLVLETLPDILHTGHLHKNGCGWYHGTLLVNSGCFQGQTDFMDNLGIEPDFGKPTVINIKGQLTPKVIDLVGNY